MCTRFFSFKLHRNISCVEFPQTWQTCWQLWVTFLFFTHYIILFSHINFTLKSFCITYPISFMLIKLLQTLPVSILDHLWKTCCTHAVYHPIRCCYYSNRLLLIINMLSIKCMTWVFHATAGETPRQRTEASQYLPWLRGNAVWGFVEKPECQGYWIHWLNCNHINVFCEKVK